MSNDVYQRLANHLDSLPAGFPPSESGIELSILQRLFTPEEAEIAMGLTMTPEPVSAVAERLHMNEQELAPKLEEMATKGLIFRIRKGDQTKYMASQFMLFGIWEYHVNKLDKELIQDINEYLPTFMQHSWLNWNTKQLRVIPISQGISPEMSVCSYDIAEDIIKSQSKIVVAPCICRKEQRMIGKGCDKPLDTCMIFGTGAYYYEENGLGRPISQQEALEVLESGQKAGLVLQPSNAQKPASMCMCCGCCCEILKTLKKLDKPAQEVNSNYYAYVDEAKCVACETCLDRCQIGAITIKDVAKVNPDYCIGCGLCVTTCETGAISLCLKEEQERFIPPKQMHEAFLQMAQERGKI